jgi:hypothetical protein
LFGNGIDSPVSEQDDRKVGETKFLESVENVLEWWVKGYPRLSRSGSHLFDCETVRPVMRADRVHDEESNLIALHVLSEVNRETQDGSCQL